MVKAKEEEQGISIQEDHEEIPNVAAAIVMDVGSLSVRADSLSVRADFTGNGCP